MNIYNNDTEYPETLTIETPYTQTVFYHVGSGYYSLVKSGQFVMKYSYEYLLKYK